ASASTRRWFARGSPPSRPSRARWSSRVRARRSASRYRPTSARSGRSAPGWSGAEAPPSAEAGASGRLFAQAIEQHGAEDDESLYELLEVGRDAEQHHPVVDHGDEQRADQRPPDAAAAAVQARPPDDDRRDDIQLVAQTGDRLGRVEPGGEDDRAHRRGHAGEDVDHGLVEVGPEAGQADRLPLATDRVGSRAWPATAPAP